MGERRGRGLGLVSLMLGAAIAAAQTTGGTSSANASAAAPLTWRECRLEHPLKLISLPARCAKVNVPEDRSRAGGAKIALHIAVVSALNRRASSSPLFILAGGPGQSATDLYTSYAGAFGRVARNHDIVLVDQRGTGDSSPLRCDYPDDWSATADSMPAIRTVTRDCLRNLGARVRFFTTAAAVADLDEVRRALGYTHIDLYGGSYGTRVAQAYMRQFPGELDAVILDGVIDPEIPIGPETPADGERALELIVVRCEGDAGCSHAYPTLRAELTALRTRFGSEHLALTLADPTTGTPLTLDFNRNVLSAALRFLSYSAAEAALMPALIHETAAGRPATLAAQAIVVARSLGAQLAGGMQNSVICSEDFPLYAGAGMDRVAMNKTYQGTDQIDGLHEICALWPRGPVNAHLHEPLHSDVATLLLSGEADPVTPPAGAERAARFMAHHRHLVLAGEGHGQLATACVPRLMADFLDHPDPAALDASCLAAHRPPQFFLSLTGPAP